MSTHHGIMTSSLRIKNLLIDEFCDFSSDIDYNSKTDVFRDVIINQCEPRRPKGASDGLKCPSAAQRKQAKRFYLDIKCENIHVTFCIARHNDKIKISL